MVTLTIRATTQYLPFYGGAKGQYLEVKKDNSGTVVSEKIVAEENISADNIIKNNNDNLLSRILRATLQSLKSTSTSLLRLHSLGLRQGKLSESDKTKLKNFLTSLGETASNTVKIVEEIKELKDIQELFKKDHKLKRYDDDGDDDYVGEEGVSIDNPDAPSDNPGYGGLIAEAKPFGLAVIGDKGLAASRPKATAVAQSGVALAQPVATAIAGLDPAALGIEFNVNPSYRAKSYKPRDS